MSKHNFGEMETTVGGWLAFFNGRKESDLKWNAINLKVTQKKQRLNNFYRPK